MLFFQKKHFFYGRKAKQIVSLQNCKYNRKCFLRKKYSSGKSLYLWGEGGLPCLPGYGPSFISVNFDNIVHQW